MRSTRRKRKRKCSQISSQYKKIQKKDGDSIRSRGHEQEEIDLANILVERRQRKIINSYSQLNSYGFNSDVLFDDETDTENSPDSDEYNDEYQSHSNSCMVCGRGGEVFMCECYECQNVCHPACDGFSLRDNDSDPDPRD